MNVEEKLAHVLNLVRQRDAITAQLNELLGGGVEEPVVGSSTPTKKIPEPVSAKGCSECGSPSRHKGTCSKAKKDGKPKASKAAPARRVDNKVLTEEEYDEVMLQIVDGLGIDNIAFSYPHVNIDEIRKASISDNYGEYLNASR